MDNMYNINYALLNEIIDQINIIEEINICWPQDGKHNMVLNYCQNLIHLSSQIT